MAHVVERMLESWYNEMDESFISFWDKAGGD